MAYLHWYRFTWAVTLLLSMTFGISFGVDPECPCGDVSECAHHYGHAGLTREVLVFSEGATNVKEWQWDTFNMLVAPSFFKVSNKDQVNTMCQAHANKRQFAITVNMDLKGTISRSSDQAKAWVDAAVSKREGWFADVLSVDLMPYFSSDVNSTDDDHVEIAHILRDLKIGLNTRSINSIKVMCVVPWKPACSKQEDTTCAFTQLSVEGCDFYIFNPDSFFDDSNTDKCRATPTIPFSKLIFGISEYLAHHVAFSQMIIGIPWHGYDFECTDFVNGVCGQKPSEDGSGACDMHRKKLKLASIYDLFREKVKDPVSSIIFNAPHFVYVNDSRKHQVWYEDLYSLKSKYRLAIELNLKGIAIMYVDDIMGYSTADLLAQEGIMWSWLGHEVLLHQSKTGDHDLHQADTVAGVAVGCLLLGTVLGVVFTCLALRRRVRKPKPPPFMREEDDFADEDPNL